MTADVGEQLREKGLRVTSTRLAVLSSLDHGQHLAADAVIDAVRRHSGTASTQGVYNALGDLVAAGLVERIEPAGSPALYELARDHPHHHIICRTCRVVVDLECDHDSADCLQPPNDLGFSDIDAEILFWGTCRICQGSGAAPA